LIVDVAGVIVLITDPKLQVTNVKLLPKLAEDPRLVVVDVVLLVAFNRPVRSVTPTEGVALDWASTGTPARDHAGVVAALPDGVLIKI
jgi:hypothetical protein